MNNSELPTKEPGYGPAYNATIITKYMVFLTNLDMAYEIFKSYETTMEV
jgi:hypothetical protein